MNDAEKYNEKVDPFDYFSLVILAEFVLVVIAVWLSFRYPDAEWLQTTALIMCVALFFVPLLPFFPLSQIEELSIAGLFSTKLGKSVKSIQQRQLVNKVVTVTGDGYYYYWVDSTETAYGLPDRDTAVFLSRGDGMLQISSDEWESLKKSEKTLPSFKSAIPKHNHGDVFLLYDCELIYQTSLSFLYKLAVLNGVDIQDKDFREWKKDGEIWVEQLTAEDFQNRKIQ